MGIGNHIKSVVGAVQNAVLAVSEERELPVSEGVINSAIERWLVKGALQSMIVRLHQGRMRLDAEIIVFGSCLQVSGNLLLEDLCINQQMQFITLRQAGKIETVEISHASRWWRALFFTLRPVHGFIATHVLRHLVNRLEGVSVAGTLYRFDLSHYVGNDPRLITMASTVNVSRGRLEDGALILAGTINFMGLFA